VKLHADWMAKPMTTQSRGAADTAPESSTAPRRPADDDLAEWSVRLGIPVASTLKDREAAADFVAVIPIGYARQHLVLGLAGSELDSRGPLEVAVGSVAAWPVLDVLGRFLRRPVRPLLVPATEILAAINLAYQQTADNSAHVVEGLDRDQAALEAKGIILSEDLLDSSGQAPVIKLVNSILFDAIKARASDVHIQPQEGRLLIRQRIDGVLFDALSVPKDFQEEVVTRCKVLGRMNIAEKRLPQDGRASVRVGDRLIDLRIASLPTSFGERVVIRFLDKSARLYTLQELGMDPETLGTFRQLIKREHGLLLVTGPTGSGKSTTLYAALQEIDAKDRNVLTLEDPIEYQLDGISQTQINEKKGMTFARGCATFSGRIPTSSWSAKSATGRRPKWRSSRR
jgi:general secretion pathway protein E